MKSKKKNILIVGFGSMGHSHLLSFLKHKKNYNFEICDKNFKKKIYSEISFSTKLPKRKKYELVIIATNSKERFKVAKKIINFNKVKSLILEKFLFNKLSEYSSFEKIIKKNKITNINVNSWGHYIAKKINLKFNNGFEGIYKLRKKGLATNLIHILDLFYRLNKNKNFTIFSNKLIKLKSKRKGYYERGGEINLNSKFGNLIIKDDSKKKHHTLILKNKKNIFTIKINMNKKCYLFKNKKLIKVFRFPIAKFNTENFFKSSFKSKKTLNNFRNYYETAFLSKKIIYFINKKFNKFYIT